MDLIPLLRHNYSSLRLSRLSFAVSLSAGSLLLVSCAGDLSTHDVRSGIKKALSGTDEQIFIGEAVENYYHPNVIMKRGEAYFEKEEYAESLIEYKHFLDLHRNHVLAPYAAFRIGEIHLKMAKTIDRDPEPIQKAIAAFEQMQRDFPRSRYESQAQQKLQECHEWIAQMHLFVGQFYYRRGSYLAATHRFEQIMKNYPDMPVAADALFFLAKSYHELGADDWARDHLVLMAEKYPDGKFSDAGKNLLERIGGAHTTTLLAQKSDAATLSDGTPAGHSARSSALLQSPTSSAPSSAMLGIPPSLDSSSSSSATALGHGFTACRLDTWC